MSPDFVAVYTQATVKETLDRVRGAGCAPDARTWVFAINTHRRYRGGTHIIELLRADPDTHIVDLLGHRRAVRPESDLEEIARLMTDYDLTVVPVIDDAEHLVGVISVDDILELVIPTAWRRRFGFFGGE